MHNSVSVVITAYDRPDFLQQAVQSVINQTVKPIEIIVVDDCSPHNIASELSDSTDPPVIYHRLTENRGANHARNVGIGLAKGQWIAFLDDDDAWQPNKLERQLERLAAAPDAIGCLSSFANIESGKPKAKLGTERVELEALKANNPYCGMSGVMALKSALEEEPFDESLPCAQDWDLFIRLARRGTLLFVDEPLFLRRMGDYQSITRQAACRRFADIHPRLAAARKHRQWIGEKHYRLRMAHMILAYLEHKPRKWQWVAFSLKEAGVLATWRCLHAKLTKTSIF